MGDLGCEVEIEPGRLIAGNAGILVSEVIFLKAGEGRDFLILDAAMNDLIRPAMYGGAYGSVMASTYNTRPLIPEVLVSGDQFAVIRPRPSFDEIIARDRVPTWLTGSDGA